MPLRVALDRIAAAATLHFTYSPELVPLERVVCVPGGVRPAGDILATALRGTGISPIVAGPDQVVLAPGRSAAVASATPGMARTTGHLERVVVTGTVTGGRERASPHALAVLEIPADAAAGSLTLAEVFNGALPGVWMWTQVPSSSAARYGSVRGASSFGVTAPKVYVDGIEAANPLMLTHLDPARVERVELIRGPQGSALYGADAISGVVNIITRHDNAGAGASPADIRASAGSAASEYAPGGVFAQEHGLTLRAGSSARSAAAGFTASTLGAYIPGATARQVDVHGSVRQIASRTILNGIVRLHAANDDAAVSPLLSDAAASFFADSTTPQRTRQYTVGGSLTLQASEWWSHTVTAGVDGYRLAGIASEALPIPSPSDSALRAARGGADRASLRLHSALTVGADSLVGATITFGAEQSSAREDLFWRGETVNGQGNGQTASVDEQVRTTYHNTGVLAQTRIVAQNLVFLTLGARVERMSSSRSEARTSLLPMTGIAVARDVGAWTLKARTAYGRGIRPARTVARGASLMAGRNYASQPLELDPEEQSGAEYGLDAYWGSRFSVQLTRFTQLVSGLVQPVAVGSVRPDSMRAGMPPSHARGEGRVVYQFQNVGAIDNTGWEAHAASTLGPLTVTGAWAWVDSRVVRLAPGYRGDLRQGDQMLEVPRRTAGISATWRAPRWSGTLSAARAMDWVNYDKLALADRVAADSDSPPLGAELRSYWRTYGGVTRLSARAAYAPTRRATLTLSGENLLDRQRDEPDNLTVVPGRTLIFGVRTTF